jgi:hypothetical protein
MAKVKKKAGLTKSLAVFKFGSNQVTFDSDPRAGMSMKLSGTLLSPLPKIKQVTSGKHKLSWTFAGPPGASYSVLVSVSGSPTGRIDDKILPGQTSASGAVDVQV